MPEGEMSEFLPADLTDEEVDRICHPLKQGAAQLRFLRSLGLTVARRPDGRPLVNRAHYNLVRGGAPANTAPSDGPRWKNAA
jgi:hypothetical protein